MFIFGYIVSDVRYNDFDDDIIKVVNDVDECVNPLPKLIIGLDNAKKYAKDNNLEFDILDHVYSNGDMWTFKKTEKREFYEQNIQEFKDMIVEYQSNNTNYYYINIYSLKYSQFKRLYNIIMNNMLNNIIIDKEMLYLSINDNDVIGISFNHLRYIGIDKDKIIERLKNGYNNRLYYTTSKNMWKLKDWFNGREYVIAKIFRNNIIKTN